MEESNDQLIGRATPVLRSPPTDDQTIDLKLKRPKNTQKQVSWEANTVDNEHLNRKKTKCCIYEKPKNCPDNNECGGYIDKEKEDFYKMANKTSEERFREHWLLEEQRLREEHRPKELHEREEKYNQQEERRLQEEHERQEEHKRQKDSE